MQVQLGVIEGSGSSPLLRAGTGACLITSAFDGLVERKRLRYANDDRAVGNWELRVKHDGSTSLWAEARGTRR